MAEIHINSMAFFAHHGRFEEEKKIGTNFVVDCEFETDTTLAEESDDINDTVNYLDVYHLIKKEMEKIIITLMLIKRQTRYFLYTYRPIL